MLPKSVAQNDSIMSTAVEDDVKMISWKGNEKRILAYPVDYDKQFNITCTYPSKLSEKETSDSSSAAVCGMKLPILLPPATSQTLTFSPHSIQPENHLRRRPEHLQ